MINFFSTLGCIGLLSLALFTSQTPALGQQATDRISPEAATGFSPLTSTKPVISSNWMVSVANPYAAQAAAAVLRDGGNAADAAIAAQLVLGLVEPQSSGLGGGAFLVYYDAKTANLTTLDGRETAPMNANSSLFKGSDGNPMKFFDAVIGGRSVGVPGTPALLHGMSKRWGTKPWQDLFDPALTLATNGFIVSPRLAALVKNNRRSLKRHPASAAYFLPGGQPITAGQKLENPAYAKTLAALKNDGPTAFYNGAIAENIVQTIQNYEPNPGLLVLSDLQNYEIKERKPVCARYRGFDICGMGPPSSGALTVGQILGLVEPFELTKKSPTDVESWRLIGDATRLAFADRGRYMADSDFVKMPIKGLIKPDYLKARSRLLVSSRALEKAPPGEPQWDDAALPRGDGDALELPSTTHFSIVDKAGNVVSMTSTIENGFGSRLMTGGFLLNNELTDFSFRAERNGKPVANRLEPGKRPRSSMAPTIVMKNGKPVLALGSPGGSRIIPYVANTLIAYLDWGMNIQQAISLPHLANRFGTYDLESGTAAEAFAPALQAMGYKTRNVALNSGLHGIAITPNSLEGGADPRREGIVIGE